MTFDQMGYDDAAALDRLERLHRCDDCNERLRDCGCPRCGECRELLASDDGYSVCEGCR